MMDVSPMYAPPKSPVTTSKSFGLAPDRFTTFSASTLPMAVIEIINPEIDEVVSPPITSTLYIREAVSIPAYNSSKASRGKRLDTPIETVCAARKRAALNGWDRARDLQGRRDLRADVEHHTVLEVRRQSPGYLANFR